MGYLTKEEYEYKAAWAKKRMEENARIETLTKVQHELLRELCQFRHELHCDWQSAFNEESSSYSYYAREIAEWEIRVGLCEKIEKEFGKKPFIRRNYYTSKEVEDILDEEGITYENVRREEEFSKLMSEAYDDFNAINNEIETFLNEIDLIHGTKYCPSGMTRFY